MRHLLLLVALMLIPTSAFAMPEMAKGKATNPEEKFKAMDKNGDGLVTREEFFEFYPNMHESAFKAIDKDGSNNLSLEEWKAFSSGHARDMGGSGMGAGTSMPSAPGKGSMGSQMPMGQGSGKMPTQTDGKNAKPLLQFTPKNAAE